MLIFQKTNSSKYNNTAMTGTHSFDIGIWTIVYEKTCTVSGDFSYIIDNFDFKIIENQIFIHIADHQHSLFLFEDSSTIIISSKQKYFKLFDNISLEAISKEDFILQDWCKEKSSFLKNVYKVTPDSILILDTDKCHYTIQKSSPVSPRKWEGNFEEAISKLNILLKKYTICDNNKVAVPISGGIDSATIAAYAHTHSKVFTYTIGTNEGNEYEGAAANANYIGTIHKEISIEDEEYMHILDHCITLQEFLDVRYAEGFVGFYKVYEYASSKNIFQIYTGYGADLIFGDIFGLEDRTTSSAIAAQALERTAYTGELGNGIAQNFSCSTLHPFLNNEIVEFALGIPYTYKYCNDEVKFIMRELLSRNKTLPQSIISHPKIGFSQGAAFDKVFAKMIKTQSNDYRAKQLYLYDRLLQYLVH